MSNPLLPDALWAIIEPLPPPTPAPGPNRLGDRQALTGILFVRKTGRPWEDRPAELHHGCGRSCWRRLRDWRADGTWDRIRAELLERPHAAGQLDGSRCAVDSSCVRAVVGGRHRPEPHGSRPSGHQAPSDRRPDGRPGGLPGECRQRERRDHAVADGRRLPADAPPGQLPGDRAYSSAGHEGLLRWLGVTPVFARRGAPHGSGLGRDRWVVERTVAHVHQDRRLKVRYERRADIHRAFPTLARIKLRSYRLAAE